MGLPQAMALRWFVTQGSYLPPSPLRDRFMRGMHAAGISLDDMADTFGLSKQGLIYNLRRLGCLPPRPERADAKLQRAKAQAAAWEEERLRKRPGNGDIPPRRGCVDA